MRILFLALLPICAGAFELRDDKALRLPLESPELCLSIPAEAVSLSSCAGLDVAAMQKQAQAGMASFTRDGGALLAMGLFRQDDWSAVVMVVRERLSGDEPWSKEALAKNLKEMAAGFSESVGQKVEPHGDQPDHLYEPLSIAGTVGVRSTFLLASPAATGMDRAVFYRVLSPGRGYWVMLMIGGHEPQARAIIEGWLRGATIEPLSASQQRRFNQTSDFQHGYVIGLWFGRAVVLAAIATAIWALLRRRKKA